MNESLKEYKEEKRTIEEIKTLLKEVEERVWLSRSICHGDINEPAAKLMKKYKEEDYTMDDIDWGILMGQMAALRWISGDEWCNLDS